MSDFQKSAVFNLIVTLIAVAAYGVLRAVAGPVVAMAAMAVLALTGLTPVLFRNKPGDERERHVFRRAGLAGGMASYLFVVVICMGVWFARYRSADPTVDVNLLPTIAMGAMAAFVLIHAASMLALLRGGLEVGE